MTPRPHIRPQEIAGVQARPAEVRYGYTIRQCADWGGIWALKGPVGWASSLGTMGKPALALWPHRQYIDPCITEGWANFEPVPLEIHEFLDTFLPRLRADGQIEAAVFPIPSGQVVLVKLDTLERDLRAELAELE